MASSRTAEAVRSELQRLEQAELYRRRRVAAWAADLEPTQLVVDGRLCTAFCSNDYLGLARDPRVAAAMSSAAVAWGGGSGSAHLVSGHTSEHHALEEELARFTGFPRALLFSTGYMANLGLVTTLAGRGDLVIEDRLNHASLLDASRLSGARVRRYAHADAGHAACRLHDPACQGRRLIVTDGVFSMDGDEAPLAALARLARDQGAALLVDDAHGLGVTGDGRGSVAAAGIGAADVTALVGTLGKAFGTFGAFVAAEEDLVEALIQRARSYIYTTAPPPALAAATRAALRIAQDEPWRRAQLFERVQRFRAGAQALGLRLAPSRTPIQPVIVGEAGAALRASAQLFEEGIWVTPIRPPTVPAGSARLRVTFSAAHAEADVDRLLAAMARCSSLREGNTR